MRGDFDEDEHNENEAQAIEWINAYDLEPGDAVALHEMAREVDRLRRACHGCGYTLVRCYDCKHGGAVACCPDCDHSEQSTEPVGLRETRRDAQ